MSLLPQQACVQPYRHAHGATAVLLVRPDTQEEAACRRTQQLLLAYAPRLLEAGGVRVPLHECVRNLIDAAIHLEAAAVLREEEARQELVDASWH